MLISNIENLSYGSKNLIEIKCDYCSKRFTKEYRQYMKFGDKSIINKDCCTECRTIRNAEIKLKNFRSKDTHKILEYMISHKTNRISAVYFIKNTTNEKMYIGSSKNLIGRWCDHFNKIKNNTHNSIKLMNDFKNCGHESFEWGILDFTFPEKLTEVEYSLIQQYGTHMHGYNLFKDKKNYKTKGKLKPEVINNLKESRKGTGTSTAKLNDESVLKIKCLIYSGVPLKEIAKMFGVNPGTISDIKNLKTWAHIKYENDNELKTIKPNCNGINNSSSKLTEDNILEIKLRIHKGESQTSIANDFNVSRTLIGHIKKGKLWNHVS